MIARQVSFYQTFTGHEKLTNIKLSIKIPFQPVHWRLQLYWWPYLCKTMHRNVETETPCQWKMTRSTCNIGPITGSMYKYCKLRGSRRALWIAFNHVHLCQIKTIFVWKCHLCKSLFCLQWKHYKDLFHHKNTPTWTSLKQMKSKNFYPLCKITFCKETLWLIQSVPLILLRNIPFSTFLIIYKSHFWLKGDNTGYWLLDFTPTVPLGW